MSSEQANLSKEWVDFILASYTYNPETGIILRKSETLTNNKKPVPLGKDAKKGFRVTTLKKNGEAKCIALNKLAWLLYYGEYPDRSVFTKNGIYNDMRIENLYLKDPKPQKPPKLLKTIKKPIVRANRKYNLSPKTIQKLEAKRMGVKAHKPNYTSPELRKLIEAPLPRLETLVKGGCKYPQEDGTWCNHKTLEGKAYCAHHDKIVYRQEGVKYD